MLHRLQHFWVGKRETEDAVSTQLTDDTDGGKKKASNAGSHLEIVAIPPDVSLQLSGCVFSPEPPPPPPFIYHPSVRREPQLVGCAPARLCLVNSTSDIHQTAEGCHSTEIDSPFVSFFVIFFFLCVFFSPVPLLPPPPHPFPNNKAPLYQKKRKKKIPQWVHLDVGAIYRNLAYQELTPGRLLTRECFKRPHKNDGVSGDRPKDLL